jgi:hypothetical protein
MALLIDLLASFAAVAVWVEMAGQDDGPAPSFVAVAAVVLGSWALARVLQMTDLDQDAMRIVGVGASFVALFVIGRLEYAPDEWLWDPGWIIALLEDPGDAIEPNAHVIAGMVALAPLWLRGVIRGQAPIEFDSVLTSASLGMLAVIVAALVTPATRETVSWGAYALVYAAAALVTLALYQSPEPDASLWSFGRRWMSGAAIIGGSVAGIAMFTAAVDPDSFGFLSPIGEPLRYAGSLVATYVIGPIIWLVIQPIRGFFWLLEQLFPDSDLPPPEPQDPVAEPEREPEEEKDRPVWWQAFWWTLGISSLLVVLIIATLLLWFAFRRFVRSKPRDPRERRESIEPASSLASDLGDLLGAIGRRFRRPPRPQQAVQIRRLYFEMLDAAEAGGLSRPAATTPLQFAPSLDAHFGSAVPSSISRAFAASRYGEVAIDAEVVRDLRSQWKRVGGSTDSPR